MSVALRAIGLCLGLSLPAAGQGGPGSATEADHHLAPNRTLDQVQGAHVDLVFAPVRPLAVTPDGHLYAVNTHGSRVQHFGPADQLLDTFAVPWGPVSVAWWDSPFVSRGPGDEEILVVSRGTHVLARLDRFTGQVLDLLDLPTEPSDLLIHPTLPHAFVSCAGANLVVQVDLQTNTILHRYPVDAVHPQALALAGTEILVAAQFSGNNTTVDRGRFLFDAGSDGILDLRDPTVAFHGLPDEDVFRIQPVARTIHPVLREAGTILFGLEVNPVTGQLWVLNTEAHNQGDANRGLTALRGRFAANRLTLADLPRKGTVSPQQVLDLDDSDPVTPGVQYDPNRTVGQPAALAFDANGNGYLAGMLTDNVTQRDANGAFVREWNVGSIPRGLLVRGTDLLVHCWGSNTLEVWDLAGGPSLRTTLSLGFDPTPAAAQVGRQLLYDAGHSQNNNLACVTCHVDGAWDFLAWDTSDLPWDDKGPLVTKTMLGIEGLLPYNWRGERADLADFNPGFTGLLGGTALNTTELDQLEQYLFTLQLAANPNQHPTRQVSAPRTPPSLGSPAGDAIRGQDLFYDEPASLGMACAECHIMPAVTAHESLLGEPLGAPLRSHFKVSVLSSAVWRKEQRRVPILLNQGGTAVPDHRALTGVGYTATGLESDLAGFLSLPLFALDDQQRRDMGAFFHQLDNGVAPAVHRAVLLDGTPDASDLSTLMHLLDQAHKGHCDLAVFGTVDLGAGGVGLRWTRDRATGLFHGEDSQVASKPVSFFVSQARQGLGSNLFVGLPVGMGERWGIDRDLDGLPNRDELRLGTDPHQPDTDQDTFPDGQEVEHGSDPLDAGSIPADTGAPRFTRMRLVSVTTRVAKLIVETDERALVRATAQGPGGSDTATTRDPGKVHTLFLRELSPSTHYTVDLTATDASGNARTRGLAGGLQTAALIHGTDTVIQTAQTTVLQDSGGTLSFRLDATITEKNGTPAPTQALLGDLYVNGVRTQKNLLSPTTDAAGNTSLTLTQTGLSTGDQVTFHVQTVWDLVTLSKTRWSMPDTRADLRRFTVTYTGP